MKNQTKKKTNRMKNQNEKSNKKEDQQDEKSGRKIRTKNQDEKSNKKEDQQDEESQRHCDGKTYLPFTGVSHHDLPACIVVVLDAHLVHIRRAFDAQIFIDLIFHGETVAVPAEAPFHVESRLVGKARHNVLDGAG